LPVLVVGQTRSRRGKKEEEEVKEKERRTVERNE